MIRQEKCIVMDIDGTLCPVKKKDEAYEDLQPYVDMVKKLQAYQQDGFYIILATARNMRTYDGNLGLINANTARPLFDWLECHEIPYDEIYFGKPWPGRGGFYVDDKSIRPQEFLQHSYEEILELTNCEPFSHENAKSKHTKSTHESVTP
ncbi:MAG: capsular biosynthesis protein [Vampirovibrio sp.]|nr:capsular biosynthesis protein [Vampirovibrio sp.]